MFRRAGDEAVAEAVVSTTVAAPELHGAGRPSRAVAVPDTIIRLALAQKTLHGWMQNRYQTRYPLALNLRNLAPGQAALVLQAVRRCLDIIDADEATTRRAAAFVESIGGALTEVPAEHAADLVERLRTARLVPQAYAACAGAVGRRTTATRRFLDFLAARLDLPDEVARSVNRRFAN